MVFSVPNTAGTTRSSSSSSTGLNQRRERNWARLPARFRENSLATKLVTSEINLRKMLIGNHSRSRGLAFRRGANGTLTAAPDANGKVVAGSAIFCRRAPHAVAAFLELVNDGPDLRAGRE